MVRAVVIDAHHVIADVTTMCVVAGTFVDISAVQVTIIQFKSIGALTDVSSYDNKSTTKYHFVFHFMLYI